MFGTKKNLIPFSVNFLQCPHILSCKCVPEQLEGITDPGGGAGEGGQSGGWGKRSPPDPAWRCLGLQALLPPVGQLPHSPLAWHRGHHGKSWPLRPEPGVADGPGARLGLDTEPTVNLWRVVQYHSGKDGSSGTCHTGLKTNAWAKERR